MERLKTFVFILLKASSFFGGRGEGSCILSRVNVYICLGLDDDYFSFHTMVRFVFVIPDMMLQAGSAGWERKGKKKKDFVWNIELLDQGVRNHFAHSFTSLPRGMSNFRHQ